jgi:type I restriction enzyme S subunit
MTRWSTVPLGDVLRHRKEFITIDDAEQYKRCRVQLHARGVVLRDRVAGADIKTKKQQVCRASEFLVAEIDAKVGGFGLVPESLGGAVVSSHYFLFEVNRSVLDPRYLDYYCRSVAFRSQVEAQGSTNYAAIRPADVLAYRLPLPPLAKQQNMIAGLDALGQKSREVEEHLDAAERDAESLLRSYIFGPAGAASDKRRMSEFVSVRQPDVVVDGTATYRFAGVYSFGRGVFPSAVKAGSEFSYERLSTVRAGDFIYPKLMAWEGALGVVPPECHGPLVVSCGIQHSQ